MTATTTGSDATPARAAERRRSRGFVIFIGVLVFLFTTAGCSFFDTSESAETETDEVNPTTTVAQTLASPSSTVPVPQGEIQAPPEVAPAAASIASLVVEKPEVCAEEVAAFNVADRVATEAEALDQIDSDVVQRADDLIACLEAAGETEAAQSVRVIKDWALVTAASQ